jgi:hypothetical protein
MAIAVANFKLCLKFGSLLIKKRCYAGDVFVFLFIHSPIQKKTKN